MQLNYDIWYHIITSGYENKILSLNDINNLKQCNKLLYQVSINAKKVIMKKVIKKYIPIFIFNLKYRFHDKFMEKYEKVLEIHEEIEKKINKNADELKYMEAFEKYRHINPQLYDISFLNTNIKGMHFSKKIFPYNVNINYNNNNANKYWYSINIKCDIIKHVTIKGKNITKIQIIGDDAIMRKYYYLNSGLICQTLYNEGILMPSGKMIIYADEIDFVYVKYYNIKRDNSINMSNLYMLYFDLNAITYYQT